VTEPSKQRASTLSELDKGRRMTLKDKNFLTAKRVHICEQKTLSTIFEARKNVFFHETEVSAPTDSIWEDSNISNDCFHNQLKPVLSILRVLGVLPIKMPARGK
jgi:hypothetical protein